MVSLMLWHKCVFRFLYQRERSQRVVLMHQSLAPADKRDFIQTVQRGQKRAAWQWVAVLWLHLPIHLLIYSSDALSFLFRSSIWSSLAHDARCSASVLYRWPITAPDLNWWTRSKEGCQPWNRTKHCWPTSSWFLALGERTMRFIYMCCVNRRNQEKERTNKKQEKIHILGYKNAHQNPCLKYFCLHPSQISFFFFSYTPASVIAVLGAGSSLSSFLSSKAPDCPISPVIFPFLFLFRSLTSPGGPRVGRPREADDSSLFEMRARKRGRERERVNS